MNENALDPGDCFSVSVHEPPLRPAKRSLVNRRCAIQKVYVGCLVKFIRTYAAVALTTGGEQLEQQLSFIFTDSSEYRNTIIKHIISVAKGPGTADCIYTP